MKYRKTITIRGGQEAIRVEIRLSDDCKNGHDDFAITATLFDRQQRKYEESIEVDGRTYWCYGGGCCHDDILKAFPKFKIFVDLHLSDFNGVPMHPIGNGKYHLENDYKIGLNYLRITEIEGKQLMKLIESQERKWQSLKKGIERDLIKYFEEKFDQWEEKYPSFTEFTLNAYDFIRPSEELTNALNELSKIEADQKSAIRRITQPSSFKKACNIEFYNKLKELGVTERWKEQANKAIKMLEKLTGETYKKDIDNLGHLKYIH